VGIGGLSRGERETVDSKRGSARCCTVGDIGCIGASNCQDGYLELQDIPDLPSVWCPTTRIAGASNGFSKS
jgi:hypothetical protein